MTFDQFQGLLGEKRNSIVFFDIETGPADEATLKKFYDESKIKLPKQPGAFHPEDIKPGNIVDPHKLADKVARAQRSHQQEVNKWQRECEEAKKEHWDTYVGEAALSSVIGQTLAIGYGTIANNGGLEIFLDMAVDEYTLITRFWRVVTLLRRGASGSRLIGFNSNKFDLPFLTRRSWILEIDAPYLRTKYNKMEDWCVDLLDYWNMGSAWQHHGRTGMDTVARALGVGGKLKNVTGDMFWKLLQTDPLKAQKYLELDIFCLAAIASRLSAT